jgi:hypothetical protein
MDIAFPVKNMKAAQKAVEDLLSSKEKAVEKLISGPPAASPGCFHTKLFSKRRSQLSPASTSRCASWTPRTNVATASLAWSASSTS